MQPEAPSEAMFSEAAAQSSRAAPKFHSIWVFLIIDSVSFALFFLVFMVERLGQPEVFSQSARQLSEGFGLLNTAILITGSWLVALAVVSARQGDGNKTRRHLIAAIAVSSGFAVVKAIEYTTKVSAGITPLTNDFFTFYYAITGFHLFHYLLGMGALCFLVNATPRIAAGDERSRSWLEAGALFWHLVDLLWIYIFAMLYLLGVQS